MLCNEDHAEPFLRTAVKHPQLDCSEINKNHSHKDDKNIQLILDKVQYVLLHSSKDFHHS